MPLLLGRREDIVTWVGKDLTTVKIHDLLTRSGTSVPFRTLHRFAVAECAFLTPVGATPGETASPLTCVCLPAPAQRGPTRLRRRDKPA